jgi:hypothetical protein
MGAQPFDKLLRRRPRGTRNGQGVIHPYDLGRMQINANVHEVSLVEDEGVKRFSNSWVGKPPGRRGPRRPVKPRRENDLGIDRHSGRPYIGWQDRMSATTNINGGGLNLLGRLDRSIQQSRLTGRRSTARLVRRNCSLGRTAQPGKGSLGKTQSITSLDQRDHHFSITLAKDRVSGTTEALRIRRIVVLTR